MFERLLRKWSLPGRWRLWLFWKLQRRGLLHWFPFSNFPYFLFSNKLIENSKPTSTYRMGKPWRTTWTTTSGITFILTPFLLMESFLTSLSSSIRLLVLFLFLFLLFYNRKLIFGSFLWWIDSQDSDLYVKFEELPSLWVYDFRNALVVPNYFLTIGNPAVGRYYIGMYGFSDSDFSIHIEVAGTSPLSLLPSFPPLSSFSSSFPASTSLSFLPPSLLLLAFVPTNCMYLPMGSFPRRIIGTTSWMVMNREEDNEATLLSLFPLPFLSFSSSPLLLSLPPFLFPFLFPSPFPLPPLSY